MATDAPVDADLADDPASLLQHLVRFDTTNPPGNERACVEWIDALLSSVGFETTTYAKDPDRPNLVARLPAEGQASPLMLYGHVDVVPAEYSSTGLVERLRGQVDGARVEVARSDHGSAVLLEGLDAAGAYVHETVLYRLVRPPGAGVSVERAAAGTLDAALFTSSLTVEHLLDLAAERGTTDQVVAGLNDAVIGAIGRPTEQTAGEHGIEVDVVPDRAEFETLARDALSRLR